MAELVGIAGDVDARDPSVADVEGGDLKHAAALQADIARQAVHPHGPEEGGGGGGIFAGEPGEEAQDPLDPRDGIEDGDHLAAAIRPDRDIVGEQAAQRRDIAALRGSEEGPRDALALLGAEAIARTLGLDMPARPHRELADRRRFPPQGRRHLVEGHAEHVVQEEGGPLQG